MAERNQEVLARMREELAQRPTVGSGELFEIAKEMDSSLAQRNLASFHASYVLPIKRQSSAKRAADDGTGEATARPRKRTQRRGRRKAGAGAAGAEGTTRTRRQTAAAQEDTQPETQPAREHVRTVFLEFAREFAEAESRTEIVQVLSKVDDYVDRVVQQGR